MSNQINAVGEGKSLVPSGEQPPVKKRKISHPELTIDVQGKIESSSSSGNPSSISLSGRISLASSQPVSDDTDPIISASSSSSSTSKKEQVDPSNISPNKEFNDPSLTFHETQDADEFFRRITTAKDAGKEEEIAREIFGTKMSKWHGASVHIYSVEEYKKVRKFLVENFSAGFAINQKAVISVFKHPDNKAKILDVLMPKAIEEGGRSLDCFNGWLPTLYSKYGFVPVAKVKFDRDSAPQDWNYARDGEPDIIFMVYDKNFALRIEKDPAKRQILMNKKISELVYSSYEEAEKLSALKSQSDDFSKGEVEKDFTEKKSDDS